MPISVLTTKLYIPPPPHNAVLRTRLVERLNAGLCQEQEAGRKLTLISAPAGFGKTTLVSEWLIGCDRKTAWLSLDEADSELACFLAYLIAAIRTVAPHCGDEALQALEGSPSQAEPSLTALLNDIAAIPEKLILVLDDYHLIDSKAIDAALDFLIEHLPPNLRLVITTREDPRLPLARLRARGHLTELRAADLRFSPHEAARFLQSMGLSLSLDDVRALEDRTEGWIAGLQLAALSLQGRPDAIDFIRSFAGDHRYIMDYLVEEVLQRQPDMVRSFLLQTSILDQLCGPLCEAVTGQGDGNLRLEALERGNFFLIPLDDRRHWFRYHHLFAQVLHTHLLAEQPDLPPVLHLRASEWYEQQGSPSEAIRHALAGEDFERAARLVELAVPATRQNRQEALLLAWLKALPVDLIRCRPVLSLAYVGALLSCGEMEGVEDHLHDAERWIDPATGSIPPPETRPAELVVFDETEFRRLPGEIGLYRTALTLLLGATEDAIQTARLALERIPEDDNLSFGGVTALLGLAYWANGDLETAYRTYTSGIANVQKTGHIADGIASAVTQADIRIAQGRLSEAMHICARGLQQTTETDGPVLRGAVDMHVGMSELLYERNDRISALQHLLECNELGEHNGFPQSPYRWRVAMARLRKAEGDLGAALDLLDAAERLYAGDFSPNVRPVHALKARVRIAQNRLDKAIIWAREHNLSAQDDLSYLREFEHITLARLLLAQSQRDRADRFLDETIALLDRLLEAAEAGGRIGSVIEILILQALAYPMQSDLPASLAALERALTLAEPEGYMRIFLDEGPPMVNLLEKAAKRGIAPDYARRLLAASGQPADRLPDQSGLVESLSERELEVLRMLRTDLSGPEIARQLMVSLNTLRTHTKNIFSKLGVNNRLGAIRKAEELSLL